MDDVRMIDANALLKEIDEEIEECQPETTPSNKFICIGLKNARKAICRIPTISAQPVKHVNWKQDASGELYCPYCMYVPQWNDDKFCANCGAKMDGDAGD